MALVIIEEFIMIHSLLYILALVLLSAVLTAIIKRLDFWGALVIMTLIVYIINYASIKDGITLPELVHEFWKFIIEQICSTL